MNQSLLPKRLPVFNYLLAVSFTLFYYLLYFTDLFTPLAKSTGLKNKWVLYGVIYTLTMLIFGVKVFLKRKKDPYQRLRTLSVVFFQLVFAFLLPILLPLLKQPEFYFSYLWPLKIEYFYPDVMVGKPFFYIIYSLAGSLILFPLLAFFIGKRFYCSWICGCGGLAETMGDTFRSLSDKSKMSWKIERVTIYSVLVFTILTTVLIVTPWAIKELFHYELNLLTQIAMKVRHFYWFFISAFLAGVLGVGLYPLFGTRVWCRFFCPMAALLGLIQKKGKFQIVVKKGMCISCGKCSKECEMGIDVRYYAQKDQSFTRASCVGCGICAYVCPRGVLRLQSNLKLESIC